MDDWKRCMEFHGHGCPGLAIGYRAALLAAKELGIGRSEDEEIVCVSENTACGVDSIQVILACTAGKGNLIFRKVGKHAYSFFDRRTGRSVRIVAKPFDRSGRPRDEIMDWILSASDREILIVKSPSYGMPEEAEILESIVCESCGESASEDMVRIRKGRRLCLDCTDSQRL